jgi:hypothetical protein
LNQFCTGLPVFNVVYLAIELEPAPVFALKNVSGFVNDLLEQADRG